MMRSIFVALFLSFAAGLANAQIETSVGVEHAATLDTGTGVLRGTIMAPAREAAVSIVILIAGSGPTDRNGNTLGLPGVNDSLKLLAKALAASGIASLRYDKRGVGESRTAGPKESDLRFEMYVADAAMWVRQLKADRRFSTVTVLGHSEGSLIGMLAVENSGADAFISVAGVARRASDLLRDQLRPKLSGELAQQNEQLLASLEQGKFIGTVPAALMALYRPSVQPYLASWMRYTPAEAIKKLSVPVLIVQGTTDAQVGVAEAEALKHSRPEAEIAIVNGMNHVLKTVPVDPTKQQASYVDPALPVAPELVDRVRAFVLAIRPLPIVKNPGYDNSNANRRE